jgi:integrase
MFSLGIRWNMRTDNPCKGVDKNTEYRRRRYLSADELGRLVRALAAYPDRQMADIVRLLLLTGARRGEVLAMRWADVDLTTGLWTKPASSTKQKQDHEVPLAGPAQQLLSEIRERSASRNSTQPLGEYVFPGTGGTGHVVEIKKGWASICKSASIAGLRLHDLRHSFASQLVSSGASLAMIGSLLGHASPVTTARYSHMFSDPQRAAVESVAAVIIAAGKNEPAPEPIAFIKRRRG